MKKSLFFALIACVALVFVGCVGPQPDPEKDTVTSITVTPAELALVPGDEVRLSYTVEPAGAEAEIVWASSDTNVVVVNDRGVITAVGYGKANVTASCGDVAGACAVWVKTYFENLSFTNAFIMDVDTTAFGGEVVEITTSDGSETFNCYLAMAELWVCADGFYVNDNGYLDGDIYATYMVVKAPMWYGTKYLNPTVGGVQFSLGQWAITEIEEGAKDAHVAAAGAFAEDEYMYYMDLALQYYNAGNGQMFSTALAYAGAYNGASTSFTGTLMHTMEYEADENGDGGYYSSYIPDGIVTKGLFSLNTNGVSAFMTGMDYNYFEFMPIANDDVYAWGCNWLFDEEGAISWGDEKVMHWGEKVVYQLGELPAAEAQRNLEPIYAPVMKIDHPEVATRIENQLKQYNTLVVKK